MSFHTPPLIIQLTPITGGTVQLNANAIVSIAAGHQGQTEIAMSDGSLFKVTETQEQVVNKIHEAEAD